MAQADDNIEIRGPIILLIENEPEDVFLFKRALSQLGYNCHVRVVGSVTQAKTYLETTEHTRSPAFFRRPDLIVSDFMLREHTALEFLKWMRSDARFSSIPVVMLSGVAPLDSESFHGLNVTQFLTKTSDLAALGQLLLPTLPKPPDSSTGFTPTA